METGNLRSWLHLAEETTKKTHAANPADRWQTGLEDSPLRTRRTSKASGLQNSSDEQSATEALGEFWDKPDR